MVTHWMLEAVHAKVYEPVKRRHGSRQPEWVRHRFPIKGGISWAIHAKIKECRKDFIHKATAKIARENALIAIGNVNSSKLAKTRMAKSVLDAGWSMFRSQLDYKASRHRAVYLNVDEKFTTQMCSSCGVIPDSSPKGMSALGVRTWECSSCGANHDRDVNAAKNILKLALSAQRRDDESRSVIDTSCSDCTNWISTGKPSTRSCLDLV